MREFYTGRDQVNSGYEGTDTEIDSDTSYYPDQTDDGTDVDPVTSNDYSDVYTKHHDKGVDPVRASASDQRDVDDNGINDEEDVPGVYANGASTYAGDAVELSEVRRPRQDGTDEPVAVVRSDAYTSPPDIDDDFPSDADPAATAPDDHTTINAETRDATDQEADTKTGAEADGKADDSQQEPLEEHFSYAYTPGVYTSRAHRERQARRETAREGDEGNEDPENDMSPLTFEEVIDTVVRGVARVIASSMLSETEKAQVRKILSAAEQSVDLPRTEPRDESKAPAGQEQPAVAVKDTPKDTAKPPSAKTEPEGTSEPSAEDTPDPSPETSDAPPLADTAVTAEVNNQSDVEQNTTEVTEVAGVRTAHLQAESDLNEERQSPLDDRAANAEPHTPPHRPASDYQVPSQPDLGSRHESQTADDHEAGAGAEPSSVAEETIFESPRYSVTIGGNPDPSAEVIEGEIVNDRGRPIGETADTPSTTAGTQREQRVEEARTYVGAMLGDIVNDVRQRVTGEPTRPTAETASTGPTDANEGAVDGEAAAGSTGRMTTPSADPMSTTTATPANTAPTSNQGGGEEGPAAAPSASNDPNAQTGASGTAATDPNTAPGGPNDPNQQVPTQQAGSSNDPNSTPASGAHSNDPNVANTGPNNDPDGSNQSQPSQDPNTGTGPSNDPNASANQQPDPGQGPTQDPNQTGGSSTANSDPNATPQTGPQYQSGQTPGAGNPPNQPTPSASSTADANKRARAVVRSARIRAAGRTAGTVSLKGVKIAGAVVGSELARSIAGVVKKIEVKGVQEVVSRSVIARALKRLQLQRRTYNVQVAGRGRGSASVTMRVRAEDGVKGAQLARERMSQRHRLITRKRAAGRMM